MIIEWLNEVAKQSPSLIFTWSSFLATAGAAVALSVALGYLIRHRAYTKAIEIVGTALALFSSLAYSFYYALLIAGIVPSSISGIVLRPVNTLLFGSLILMAGMVVNSNKVTRQLIELNTMLKRELGKA
ncbi:MAG: hypothetical protein IPL28_25600 [Chloroflexi bacterium]|nr:hypothetical protein [Chloroflexota bacterium]